MTTRTIAQLSPADREFVATIHAQCEEHGDCLIWKGGTTPSGYARISIKGRWYMVRRLLAAIKFGRDLQPRELASCTCREPACLDWDHIRVADIQVLRAETGARGLYSLPTKLIAMTRSRRRTAKLDDSRVAAIRESQDPSHVEAAKHNVSPSYVRRIRNLEKWKPLGSPFTGLGAR